MIDMFKRHEIQVLRRAGHNQTEVAELAAVSRRSVRRVEAEPSVGPTELGMATQFVETDSVAPAVEPESSNNDPVWAARGRRRSLVQKVRDWLQGTA